jgi:hypothetical protein
MAEKPMKKYTKNQLEQMRRSAMQGMYTESDLQQAREEERERCADACDKVIPEFEKGVSYGNKGNKAFIRSAQLCAEAIRQLEDK